MTHAPGPEGIFIFVYGSDLTREKEAERALRQSEKMATLGTLAAGVAHELNNPAAAVQRAAEQLEQRLIALQAGRTAMAGALSAEKAWEIATELDTEARAAAKCSCDLAALERSDLESELEDWLLDRGVEAPWEVAPALVEGNFDLSKLEALSTRVGEEAVGAVAAWLASAQQAYRLLDEIRQGGGRLVEIVGAMKNYSYLGQAPIQDVDVNEGLRSTLVILRSKLRGGVVVHQHLASDLPRIEAYGSELNQVWTNLLDNAADAMEGEGEIQLRSHVHDGHVVVEVEDNGPGVPEDIQPRVFDPFFTTKPPGKGTGLGLNTSYNIVVKKHGGTIRVGSNPGQTVFTVSLPIHRKEAASAGDQDVTAEDD
jgi:signal transduction histidine kinase